VVIFFLRAEAIVLLLVLVFVLGSGRPVEG
jgi:hypothetical protein